ncbi:MAG TPA: zf-HC2 domain-containing protein [Vicinamibacteria bacterium]|nr:zf-HC2 domain-containing protein [Vicinamibacteria bacterium]
MTNSACPDFEGLMERLLFGDLTEPSRENVERHLSVCGDCRDAFDDAKLAMEALRDIEAPPLPYADTPKVIRTLDLQRSRSPSRWMAMAAVLLIGVGIGYFLPRGGEEPEVALGAPVDPDALAALERAELLSDVGVRYTDGLRGVLEELLELAVLDLTADEAAYTRERARTLIRDGALLERLLDSEKDRDLLRAIRRAEPFLEELAALESSTTETNVRHLQASLRDSNLPSTLAELALDDDIESALASSGWLANDNPLPRKDF